tara:strand:- start:462 stop:602 length:141 start_codon:yes stop_codon:yes gene_type:complete
MIFCVLAMIIMAFFFWNADRKIPKEADYIYQNFKAEDVDWWLATGQ